MAKMSEGERITRQTYNLVVEDWMKDRNDLEYWKEEFAIFSRILPAGRILDIGCGGGRDYPFFRDGGYDYVGLDFCSGFLAEMRRIFPEAELVEANMRLVPDLFRESSFDGFWAAASLLHIEKSGIKEVLRGIKRVVVPNGIGFISLKEGEGEGIVVDESHSWSAEDARYFSFYTRSEFTDILIDCGIAPILIRRRLRKNSPAWLEFFVKCFKA